MWFAGKEPLQSKCTGDQAACDIRESNGKDE